MRLSLVFLLCLTANAQEQGALRGITVNSTTGAALRGVHIRLAPPPFGSDVPTVAYGALSDDAGQFAMAAVSPGTYLLHAERPGFFYAPSAKDGPPSPMLTIKPGQQLENVRIEMAPRAIVSGHVLDEKGNAMAWVPVHVSVASPRDIVLQLTLELSDLRMSFRADERGEYRIALPPGKFLVHAQGESRDDTRADGTLEPVFYDNTYYPAAADEKSAAIVEARAGQETAGVDIRMVRKPLLRIAGIVTGLPASTAATVHIRRDMYNEGAELKAAPEVKWIPVRNGNFSVWRVPPGKYAFSAEGRTPDGRSLKSITVDVELADSNVDNIALKLIPEFDIGGQIQWDGQPPHTDQLQNAAVRLGRPADGGDWPGTEAAMWGRIASDGAFRIPSVTVGRRALALEGMPENVYIKSVTLGTGEMPDRTLDLRGNPGDARLTVLLSAAGASISGVVTDSHGPRAKVSVYLALASHDHVIPRTAETAADGSYSFHGVPPGKYKLYAGDPKGAESMEIAEGESAKRNLTWPESAP
jgi:hypothetical protein